MFSLKNPLITRVLQTTSRRPLSLMDRFCKKDNNGGENNKSVTIQLNNAFKLYNLEDEPSSSVCLDKKTALTMLTNMQTIRRMENACANLYTAKLIRGFCHLYVGQEACAVGMKASMRSQDTVITSYRSHGWTWLMGVAVHALIAELCQKQTGCSRGKGGSMHTYAPNFFGGNGIVGAQTPLGTGVAFAHAYRCDGGVNFALYGDGAGNQGQLYEAMNIACLWKLPVVYVCENNKYGMGTAIKRHACSTDFYTRGDYIPGLWVNGNDILAVRSATEFAIKHATTCGPLVMELETYRYHGHSMSDPGTSYRQREEVQMMRQKHDPLTNFKDLCLKECLITEEEFKKMDDAIKEEVNDALKQVRQDKDTEMNEMASDIYLKNLEGDIRGLYKRDIKHFNVGAQLVPLGAPKPTPRSQIKQPEKEKQDDKADAKGDVKADAKADPKAVTKDKPKEAAKAAPKDVKTASKVPPAAPTAAPPASPPKDKKPTDPKKK